MGEAIELTSKLYPGLLEYNQNLLFMLKCRQFIEMVNGTDSEVYPRRCAGGFSPSYTTSPRATSPIQTSVIQSTKSFKPAKGVNIEEINNQNNIVAMNGSTNNTDNPVIKSEDSDMDMDTEEVQNGHSNNSKVRATNGYQNGNSHSTFEDSIQKEDEDMGEYHIIPNYQKRFGIKSRTYSNTLGVQHPLQTCEKFTV